MKKRIMALALCLLLCLPFILTACGGKFVDTVSSTKPEDKASYSKLSQTDVDGTNANGISGKFLYTTEVNEEFETTHNVYNVLTGLEVFSETDTKGTKSSESYSISFLTENLFCVQHTELVFKTYETEVTYALYNENGLLTEDVDGIPEVPDNFDCEAIIYNNALYFYNDGKLEVAKSFYENQMKDVVADLAPAGDKYVLVNGKKIFVFNSDFEQIDVQTFTTNSKAYYSNESSRSFILNNGNVLVQVESTVGDYSDVFDADYDYVKEGVCYVLDTYLYNTKKLNYKSISLDYIINDVDTLEDLDDVIETVNKAENKAEAYKIDGEEIIYGVNNDATVTLWLTNDGKVEELEITDEGTSYTAISDTRYYVEGDYFVRLYDEKNNVIAEYEKINSFNKNFIVTNEAIYKTTDGKEVVKFDKETNTTCVGLTVDSVIYSSITDEDDETGEIFTTYYLVTTTGTQEIGTTCNNPTVNGEDKVVVGVSEYYYTVTTYEYEETEKKSGIWNTASKEIAFFQTNGTEIETLDAAISDGESLSTVGSAEFDDVQVIVFSYSETNKKGEVVTELYYVTLSR